MSFKDIPKRSKDSMEAECNINTIMKKWREKQQNPTINEAAPQYGDFSLVTSMAEAQNLMQAAAEDFMQMDPEIRSTFNNDPLQFQDYITECIKTDDGATPEQIQDKEALREFAYRKNLITKRPEKQQNLQTNSVPKKQLYESDGKGGFTPVGTIPTLS